MSYEDFLRSKEIKIESVGREIEKSEINPILFPFQKDIVKWAIKKGRCAVFLDTGLGKTFIQLEWARLINQKTLIIAPLSVARQTIREGKKINIEVNYCHDLTQLKDGINITNYELIDNFSSELIQAIILDESSILKSLGGKIRAKLINKFSSIKYKLCCTATPAPNDFIELGNHTHFLGVCTRQEMLAMFFINANREHTLIVDDKIFTKKGSNKGGQEWRLKHHAENDFFNWMSQWSITMMKPSDLGYSDDGFLLPSLSIHPHFIKVMGYKTQDQLFFTGLHGIAGRAKVRGDTVGYKLDFVNSLVTNHNDGQWIIWCGLEKESSILKANLPDSVEVKGSDSQEFKVKSFEDFQDGNFPILITKPKIGAFGMNFQNASNMIFFGMNDSWETYYQAIRREWRYGQKKPVNVYLVLTNIEQEIYENILRKEKQAYRLRINMVNRLKDYEKGELEGREVKKDGYKEEIIQANNWTTMRGDSAKRLKEISENSVDLSIYSPPFADLFVYSDSKRDLGNCRNWDEFFRHYEFIIKELLRVTKQGRLSCVHTSDIPAMANRDGYIGLRDFPGEVLRWHEKNGWIFVGRAFIQKNPQSQAIRVKCKSLLFVQMNKDSSHSRPALIDQILIFKKPGENQVPITPVKNKEMDNELWIKWAHGIWTDINETNTLQYYIARDREDEKHICPLQLETIERCIKLYSNPGETILTPFMGIGSEAFMAIKLGRKAIGIELKDSYFKVAVNNLKSIQETLF